MPPSPAAGGTRRLSSRLALVASLPVLSVALAVASCVGLSTAPKGVLSIQFDSSLQLFPTLVAGDSLRDSTGAVAALRAIAFDASGKAVTNAPITFLTIDTTAKVTTSGSAVVAGNYAGLSARIFALTGSLESSPLTLPIVSRPDTLSLDTLTVNLTAGTKPILTDRFTVLVRTDSAATLQPVPHWPVGYRLEYHGQALAITDTAIAYFISPEDSASSTGVFHPSRADTTAPDGRASRILFIKTAGLAKPLDSLVVYATARYRGSQIPGSPLRRVVFIQ